MVIIEPRVHNMAHQNSFNCSRGYIRDRFDGLRWYLKPGRAFVEELMHTMLSNLVTKLMDCNSTPRQKSHISKFGAAWARVLAAAKASMKLEHANHGD